jgi:hypothetical protein
MQPAAELIRFPAAYGTPTKLLAWDGVENRLAEALHYWIATTRPDGRPHVVPVDGVWTEGACYFSGDRATVHQRNLRSDPRVVLHLDDSESATIVEGIAEWHVPTPAGAKSLNAASKAKYGYAPGPAAYLSGVWRLAPATVLAWNVLHVDATRFTFT